MGKAMPAATPPPSSTPATPSADGAICLPASQERDDYPLENYLLGGNGLNNVTLSNLILTSRPDQPLDGAIMMKCDKNLELFNLLVQELSLEWYLPAARTAGEDSSQLF